MLVHDPTDLRSRVSLLNDLLELDQHQVLLQVLALIENVIRQRWLLVELGHLNLAVNRPLIVRVIDVLILIYICGG